MAHGWKKPTLWAAGLAAAFCILAGFCFLANPKSANVAERIPDSRTVLTDEQSLNEAIEQAVLEHYHREASDGCFCVSSHRLLSFEENNEENTVTAYAWVLYEEYEPKTEGQFVVASRTFGVSVPAELTFSHPDGSEITGELLSYWEPRDGSYYTDDLNRRFSKDARKALKQQTKFVPELIRENIDKANEAFERYTFTEEGFLALVDEIRKGPMESSSPGL